jgi:ubiquinone/menaquinone biosynthesis C-methylase UbiE
VVDGGSCEDADAGRQKQHDAALGTRADGSGNMLCQTIASMPIIFGITENTSRRHRRSVMQVASENAEQLRAWDGEQGAYWVDRAERFDEGVAGYRDRLLTAAAIGGGEHVLDIGCGSGQMTRDAARRAVGGSAVGVDLSSRAVELARRLAERDGVVNVRFLQADAQIHSFPEQHFDVVISRHGAMFFGDPVAAFINIARAVRPGGRLVLLTWQPWERNEWLRSFRGALAVGRELPTRPGALEDPDQVRPLLASAGFTDVRMDELAEPMYFGRDADDAFRFVSGQLARMVDDLDDGAKARALDDLRATMAAHQTPRGVYFDSAAWLIQARRP